MKKCGWCIGDPIYEAYHDHQWGVPIYHSQQLFEALCLESFQAGLSWITILKKRDNFRQAFDNFNPHLIAHYDDKNIEILLQNAGIVRHKGKILAIINNAKLFLEIERTQTFSNYLWHYVGHKPIQNNFETMADLPSSTPLSTQIAKDFKKQGFKFLGATTVYAFMQAVGMVNNHLTSCFKYQKQQTGF
ncbi:MAG: DNA-3-methyladenine glycosylase I [Alphaproteobacteria bacterium]|jgi:DNA-3-methyladenine glycosylase I